MSIFRTSETAFVNHLTDGHKSRWAGPGGDALGGELQPDSFNFPQASIIVRLTTLWVMDILINKEQSRLGKKSIRLV